MWRELWTVKPSHDLLILVPNACVTLGIPVDIFDFDILPGMKGLKKLENPGSCPISDYK